MRLFVFLSLLFMSTSLSTKQSEEVAYIQKNVQGRLLVSVSETASFSPEEFSEVSRAHFIQVNDRNPFKSFPENFFDYPFVVVSALKDEDVLRQLAIRFGYRLISFSEENLSVASSQAKALLSNIPKYTSELSHMSKESSFLLYDLMQKVDQVFKKNQITYWATGGTLLGALRYKGIMPWDDDLDICILDTDEKKLKDIEPDLDAIGIGIFQKDIYKIFFQNGFSIEKAGVPRPYKYPFIDVFIMTLEKGRERKDLYVHKAPYFYCKYGSEDGFTYSQIENIVHVPFGPLMMPIAGGGEAFLTRNYGTARYPNLWKVYSKEGNWNHKLEAPSSISGAAFVVIDDFFSSVYREEN
ncbi:MAG: LicD family protein [Chlamydiota bacterium]